MKKPDESKTSGTPKPVKAETNAENTSATAKKQAAQPGAILSKDVGPGDGKAAAASGAGIEPVKSNLVGNKIEGLPAAVSKTAKPEEKPVPSQPKTPESPLKLESAKAEPAKPEPAKPQTAKPTTTASEPPKPAPAKPASTQSVKREQSGFWPLVFGGVVAAGIGGVATVMALPYLPASWLPEQPTAEIDLTAIQNDAASAAEAAADRRIEELRAELQSAPTADGASTDLTAMQQRIDAQAQQIDELVNRPAFDPALAERLQTLTAQAAALETQIQTAAEQAQSQITAAQVEAQKLQEAAEGSTRRAEAVAAIAALQTALDRGLQPDEARQTMEGVGIETPDALNREIASLGTLQSEFPDAVRAALRAALREESASGQGNVFTNFLRAQTGARSVEPREGDDPDAILSRANAEVEAGRIGNALTEMDALPDVAKNAPLMAEWIAKAAAYRDAQAALSDLSATSN